MEWLASCCSGPDAFLSKERPGATSEPGLARIETVARETDGVTDIDNQLEIK